MPVTEYAPLKIKKSITGRGSASKEQVAGMLMQMLNLKEVPKYLDATDGLAAAVCLDYKTVLGQKGYSSWANFIKNNENRIDKR